MFSFATFFFFFRFLFALHSLEFNSPSIFGDNYVRARKREKSSQSHLCVYAVRFVGSARSTFYFHIFAGKSCKIRAQTVKRRRRNEVNVSRVSKTRYSDYRIRSSAFSYWNHLRSLTPQGTLNSHEHFLRYKCKPCRHSVCIFVSLREPKRAGESSTAEEDRPANNIENVRCVCSNNGDGTHRERERDIGREDARARGKEIASHFSRCEQSVKIPVSIVLRRLFIVTRRIRCTFGFPRRRETPTKHK